MHQEERKAGPRVWSLQHLEAEAGGPLSIKYEANLIYTADSRKVSAKWSYSKAKPKEREGKGQVGDGG